jgi:chorismate mutase
MFFNKDRRPIIIAGPCSAESREQVLETAKGLQGLNISLFRAGVWKPRTRPGAFEGAGPVALQWLREAKEIYGLPFTVEVAETTHVEQALTGGADALWIGARTTVNPFSVQRLADALKGTNVPVLVKNPVIPDVDLWLGGIERFERAGVTEVAAIHRGFPAYGSASSYRNPPAWAIPIELRRRRPELTVICDPSHISGKRAGVPAVSQKAMDMGFDGLMIETHFQPDIALSDAAQQLTPDSLKELLAGLIIRHDKGSGADLERLRAAMDAVDAEIIDLLARRIELSDKLGLAKKEAGMTAYQPDRWREILATRSAWAKARSLNPTDVAALFQIIHVASVKRQLRILQED